MKPKSKSPKKGEKKKKGVPPSAGASRRKKKPFRLQVGKTYESERGGNVRIIAMDGTDYTDIKSRFSGHLWKRNGIPHFPDMDTARKYGRLVREVKGK